MEKTKIHMSGTIEMRNVLGSLTRGGTSTTERNNAAQSQNGNFERDTSASPTRHLLPFESTDDTDGRRSRSTSTCRPYVYPPLPATIGQCDDDKPVENIDSAGVCEFVLSSSTCHALLISPVHECI